MKKKVEILQNERVMSFYLKKLASMLFSLWVIITFTFFLMKEIPGDPFAQEQTIPAEILTSLKAHYGLNDPWYIQYLRYLKAVATWDLGPSFKYKGRTVNMIIKEGFPVSFALGMQSLIFSLALGVLLGSLAAFRQNKWQDYMAMLLATIGISIPSFILATLLQYLFAVKLALLPVARWGTFSHSILPTLALSALPTAFIARLTRANLLEVLQQDYIKTARSKGLCETRVALFHCLRNGCLPVLSYLGQLAANILVGSFVIEKIFGIPGLGQWFVTSVTNRDYTIIMGLTVFYSALLLFAVFLQELALSYIDPRIKMQEDT